MQFLLSKGLRRLTRLYSQAVVIKAMPEFDLAQYVKVLRFAIFRLVRHKELTDSILEKAIYEIWDTVGLYNEQEQPLLAWMLNIAKSMALKELIVTKLELSDQGNLKFKLA